MIDLQPLPASQPAGRAPAEKSAGALSSLERRKGIVDPANETKRKCFQNIISAKMININILHKIRMQVLYIIVGGQPLSKRLYY